MEKCQSSLARLQPRRGRDAVVAERAARGERRDTQRCSARRGFAPTCVAHRPNEPGGRRQTTRQRPRFTAPPPAIADHRPRRRPDLSCLSAKHAAMHDRGGRTTRLRGVPAWHETSMEGPQRCGEVFPPPEPAAAFFFWATSSLPRSPSLLREGSSSQRGRAGTRSHRLARSWGASALARIARQRCPAEAPRRRAPEPARDNNGSTKPLAGPVERPRKESASHGAHGRQDVRSRMASFRESRCRSHRSEPPGNRCLLYGSSSSSRPQLAQR